MYNVGAWHRMKHVSAQNRDMRPVTGTDAQPGAYARAYRVTCETETLRLIVAKPVQVTDWAGFC